jgi:hypothetical protein
MKTLQLLAAATLLSASTLAQDVSAPAAAAPDLEVVQKSWRRETHNPDLDADPFRANDQHRELAQARAAASELNIRRTNQNNVALGPPKPAPLTVDPASSDKPRDMYVYSMKVKNRGAKSIRSLTWEYVFADPKTGHELSRFRHEGKVKIGPGKSGGVTFRTLSPPSGVVSANQLGLNEREQFSEAVVILRVEYEDGSIWALPPVK